MSYPADPEYPEDITEWDRELEYLMWSDYSTPGLFQPFRERRNMTTVHLPRFPDDDALGGVR